MLQPLPVHSVGPVAVRIPPSNLDKSDKFGSNFYVIFVLYYLLFFLLRAGFCCVWFSFFSTVPSDQLTTPAK